MGEICGQNWNFEHPIGNLQLFVGMQSQICNVCQKLLLFIWPTFFNSWRHCFVAGLAAGGLFRGWPQILWQHLPITDFVWSDAFLSSSSLSSFARFYAQASVSSAGPWLGKRLQMSVAGLPRLQILSGVNCSWLSLSNDLPQFWYLLCNEVLCPGSCLRSCYF